MPIYEYECSECKNIIEIITTSIKDKEEIPICEHCNLTMNKNMGTFNPPGQRPDKDEHNQPGGITQRIPIIKDRKTGRILSGPNLPH